MVLNTTHYKQLLKHKMAAENTNETPKIKDISSSTQKRLIKYN